MASWTVYALECEDKVAREVLMDWFEENQPVEFPEDRYSVFAEIESDDGGTTGADYAWLDRYLYITVMGEAGEVIRETMDGWERAALAEFDGETETVVDGTFVRDTESGAAHQVEGHPLQGPQQYAGNGVMYALAMDHQFRFRSYSAQSPTDQAKPHPDAFDAPTEFVDDFEEFIDKMSTATDVEPNEEGLEFLRNDPADDDRYVYGETYGPT